MKANNRKHTCTLLLIFLAVILASVTSAQTSLDEVKASSQAFADSVEGYTHDERMVLIEASENALKHIDDSIDELNTRIRNDWHKMSKVSKQESQNAMRELKIQRLVVAEDIGALEYGSLEVWDEIKSGLSASFDALQLSWESALQKIDSR